MDPTERKSPEEEHLPEPRDTIPLPPLFLFEEDEDDQDEDDSSV